ncbi:MAG: S26 family signal peptidase [Bacteroidaceae bacterium]|nr:S26 family signal peptidase [Bacteroidaceae bacterium]
MIVKPQKQPNKKLQWAKFIIVLVLYLLFLYWLESWLGLIVIPFIYDVYITKKIKWQWWKNSEGLTPHIMSWVDAIVFALVAVYFINLFFFQNYVIPSSSLEKSLLTGDYLFVSKVSYGPRIPNTPLTMPLTQHTMPVIKTKSYIEWPQWDYKRAKGLGDVQLNDIVVFNYPAGDTIVSAEQYQANDFYGLCMDFGMQQYEGSRDLGNLSPQQQRDVFQTVYNLGHSYIEQNPNEFGVIDSRPVDRRENYVKRCVGLPGQTLQIKDRIIYLDGKPNKEPDNVQYTYKVQLAIPAMDFVSEQYDDFRKENGITNEDLNQLTQFGFMPLTKQTAAVLKGRKDICKSVSINTDAPTWGLYPLNKLTGWSRDNYGPIWIPKKGAKIDLSIDNIALYERCIKNYEGNELEVNDSRIFINGKEAKSYTFKLDYYWMMGDNRHNSADSRYWGFVPEDHIVGKPIFIWFSSDPDRSLFSGGLRWHRLFRFVDNIK